MAPQHNVQKLKHFWKSCDILISFLPNKAKIFTIDVVLYKPRGELSLLLHIHNS